LPSKGSEAHSDAPAGRPAAFFDVDGTLLTVQSGALYIGYLRRRGLMALSDQLRIYWCFLTYRLGIMNMSRLADVLSRWLKGRAESEVAAHCRDWYESEVCEYFCEEMLERLEEHRRAGHVLVLLTGGTRYLNDWIAADLDVEHVLASRLAVDSDGCFTGQPDGPLCYGRGKVEYAEAFAREQGISLEDSYYYADSISDLAMLERVGHPRVVGPDPRLRIEARRRLWEVLDEQTRTARRRAA